MPRLALSAIVVVALAFRVWQLDTSSFIIPYYYAGVRSMTASWHNFFFNAFDPAGFISLDKPPVAFWIQAASAKLFGFGPLAVLLPQVAEGIGAILILYALVRRRFGVAAGLLAASVLAVNPVSVAIDRSNNTESCLILVLLLAAWALTRAVETSKPALVVLAAAITGVAFNVKMLVALGVVPIFALVYLIGGPGRPRRRLGHLIAAGAVFAVVSLSWSAVYDLTPPRHRPYAGSTIENSMLELAIGHNGIQRFIRKARVPGQAAPALPGSPPIGIGPATGRDYAPAGPWRLAAPSFAAQIGWLFPLVLIGGIAAWLTMPRRPSQRFPLALPGGITASLRVPIRSSERLALALWAGWALIYGIVFSAAGGLFHVYYLVAMAPALCALAGIGAATLWSLHRDGRAPAWLLPATIVATALWQARIVDFYLPEALAVGGNWLVPGLLAAAASTAIGVALRWPEPAARPAFAGLALLLSLALPAAWSAGAASTPRQTGFPAARPPYMTPVAEQGRWRWAHIAGALAPDPKLRAFLEREHRGETYLLATLNTRQAAPLIIATGLPVMALGGFNGRDPVLRVEDFAGFVAKRRVRFALIGDGAPGLRRVFGEDGQKQLTEWIREHGRRVDPALWRATAAYPIFGDASRPGRPAETAGAELYDLRSAGE